MNLETISYLVGVIGASFMSSNAMYSLFNWKLRNIRDEARTDYAKALERYQRGEDRGESGQIGRCVINENEKSANLLYVLWLVTNIAPVVISVVLACVVSAPVIFPIIQAWTERWIILLLRGGVLGLVVSLLAQTVVLGKMIKLRRTIERRQKSPPPREIFQR